MSNEEGFSFVGTIDDMLIKPKYLNDGKVFIHNGKTYAYLHGSFIMIEPESNTDQKPTMRICITRASDYDWKEYIDIKDETELGWIMIKLNEKYNEDLVFVKSNHPEDSDYIIVIADDYMD